MTVAVIRVGLTRAGRAGASGRAWEREHDHEEGEDPSTTPTAAPLNTAITDRSRVTWKPLLMLIRRRTHPGGLSAGRRRYSGSRGGCVVPWRTELVEAKAKRGLRR